MYRTVFSILYSVILLLTISTHALAQDPLLEVTSPGSSTFQVGTSMTITWNSLYKKEQQYMNQTFPITIKLFRTLQPSQITLVDSLKDNGSYTWTIPDSFDMDTTCQLYVGAMDCPYANDRSNTFTIMCPTVFALNNFTKDTTVLTGTFPVSTGVTTRMYLSWKVRGDVPRTYDTYYKDADSSTWHLINENVGGTGLQWELKNDKKTKLQFKIQTSTDTFTLYSGIVTILPTPVRIELPLQVTTTLPTFQWHPSDGASAYIFEVMDDITGKIKSSIIDTLTDTFYTPATPLKEASYYWRAIPYYEFTTKSLNIKEFSNFRLKFAPPQLVAPSVKPTRERTPLFIWHKTPASTTYKISLASDSLFTAIIDSATVNDTFYAPQVDLPFGISFWKVSTQQTAGTSIISKVTVVPDALPLLNTFNGAALPTAHPVFTWCPVKNASSYKLIVYQQKPPALGKSKVTGSSTIVLTKILSDTFFTPAQQLAIGAYSWSVSSNKNFDEYTYTDQFVIKETSTFATEKRADKQVLQLVTIDRRHMVHVRSDASAPLSLNIFDLNGKVRYSNPRLTGSLSLSKVIPPGIYVVRAVCGGLVQSVKVFLE